MTPYQQHACIVISPATILCLLDYKRKTYVSTRVSVYAACAFDQVLSSPLPFGLYGAGMAYSSKHKVLVIVGGNNKYFFAAADNLLLLNLTALPPPQPCLYRTGFNPQWWKQTRVVPKAGQTWPYRKKFLDLGSTNEL